MSALFSRTAKFVLPVCLVLSLVARADDVPVSDPVIPAVHLPLPVTEKLPNGLTIAWFLDDKLPVVDLAMVIRSGSRDDLPGKSGTTELVMRMLERGSAGISAQQMAHDVESLGASEYSSADDDASSVGMHGLSKDAVRLIDVLSKIVLKPDFLDAEFAREQGELAERWGHLADSAESLAGFAFTRAMAQGTSYARGSADTLKELKSLKKDDIVSHYRRHFTPENAILAVVGRVERASFRAEIVKRFGDWQGKAPAREWRNYRDSRFARGEDDILVIHRPNLPQAQVRIGFPIPSIRSPNRYGLSVANSILGEYFNSRLNALVRDRLGLAYGISSSLNYMRGLSYLSIASATQTATAGELLKATLSVIGAMKIGNIPEQEIQVAKDYLLGGYPISVSTLDTVATRWLSGAVYGLGDDYLNEFPDKVAAIDKKKVVKAIDEAFRTDRLTIVMAGDAPKIVASLKKSGFRKVKIIEAATLMR